MPADSVPEFSALEVAYKATCYRVQAAAGRVFELRVAALHPELDAWLAAAGWDCWAVLTAWNPASRLCSAETNAEAQLALRAVLAAAGCQCWPSRNIALQGDWPEEESLFVPGLGAESARQLAGQFGQNAVLVGERGEPARLLWTFEPR